MQASRLIAKMAALVDEFGDLPVVCEGGADVAYAYFVEEPDGAMRRYLCLAPDPNDRMLADAFRGGLTLVRAAKSPRADT